MAHPEPDFQIRQLNPTTRPLFRLRAGDFEEALVVKKVHVFTRSVQKMADPDRGGYAHAVVSHALAQVHT